MAGFQEFRVWGNATQPFNANNFATARSALFELTLEIGHVRPHIAVQCIDNHLPVRGASDLDPAVDQARSGRCTLPCGIITNVLGLGEEIREDALVNLGLAIVSPFEQGLASGVERTLEEGKKREGRRSKDLAMSLADVAEDGDAREDSVRSSHFVEVRRLRFEGKTTVLRSRNKAEPKKGARHRVKEGKVEQKMRRGSTAEEGGMEFLW